MTRLRSQSVDLPVKDCVTQWSKGLLCGMDSSSLTSTFYSKVDSTNHEKSHHLQKEDGTLKKLCDTIRRPFRNKSRSQTLKPDVSRILSREEDPEEPVLFTAIAIRDHVPHPYDNSGLPFKTGDEIKVTGVSETGVWSGWCGGRTGQFKFIDVRKVDVRIRENVTQSHPELEHICQRSKSVADLLSSINLDNLIPKFVLNGFDTTASIKSMNDDDLEYLGVTDDHTKDLIMGTIDWLNLCENSKSPAIEKKSHLLGDSGYNSVESFTTQSLAPPSSFLHSTASNTQYHSISNLLIMTSL